METLVIQMTPMIKNRVAALIGEKQAKENRFISASEVARETGLTRQVISKWVNNEIVSYRSDMMEKLCAYFDCTPGDLLYIEAEDAQRAS